MTPPEVLAVARGWADSVLVYQPTAAALTTQAGTVTTDMRQTTLALRARIRYAAGDLAGAAADAALVADGHMAWVLREDPEDRRNAVASIQGNNITGAFNGQIALRDDDAPRTLLAECRATDHTIDFVR